MEEKYHSILQVYAKHGKACMIEIFRQWKKQAMLVELRLAERFLELKQPTL